MFLPSTTRALLATCLLLALLPSTLGAQGPPRLELTLTSGQVEIQGVTPGSQVVLQQVAHLPRGDHSVRHQELFVLEDDDRDGQIEFTPEDGIPWRSIWVAIDRQGDVALAVPEGYPLRLLDRQPAVAGSSELVLPTRRAEVLLVRGADGMWGGRVVDGGDLDEDGPANGSARVRLDRLPIRPELPEPAVEALARFRPGDVVVVIDPMAMAVSLERVAPPGNGA